MYACANLEHSGIELHAGFLPPQLEADSHVFVVGAIAKNSTCNSSCIHHVSYFQDEV